ncbi:AMP-binding protein [Halomonas sp. Bachu 37]|uniref:acyl-CoA synthetase n=1 Tax=Halomonas kashgarensis TaxID=3084920 RepID=UPI0032179FB6
MSKLTELTTYADAQRQFSPEKLWELFDGSRSQLNISHECIDRHSDDDAIAVRIAHADGHDEALTFQSISRASARFANYLIAQGVKPGEPVAIMLEPSLPFYVGLFGAMKMGAVAVPLFTLFGPDGLRLRMEDCKPRLLLTNAEKAPLAEGIANLKTVVADQDFMADLGGYSDMFECQTRGDDLAALQYTSGTTRELPDAVRHTHRSIVTLMTAALYGTGLRPGDRFFCPSSPAWGHGLWHGTLAPLALGITTGTFSGKFDAERLLRALQDYRITNLSAASTHYRMMRNSGAADRYHYTIRKLSFTGEPMDSETADFVADTFGVQACSMYGTTEIGVILVSYPGAEDFPLKPGSLGKPVPGARVEVHDANGKPCEPGVVGELMIWRNGEWFPTKDLARIDKDGYFEHAGRADDVIISAGWTMSAVEIEDAVLKHPDIQEAAAIGVPDELRGQVVKVFAVSGRPGNDEFISEIQELVRTRLSRHEYPRIVEFVSELPKTPAGKVHRKVLRDREKVALGSDS